MNVNEIILGDAYEVIKTIPDKSIDLIYTDIPYLHETGGIGKSDLGANAKKMRDSIEAFNKGIDFSILTEFIRVLKKMNLFIWCSDMQITDLLNWARDNEYYFDILPWTKSNPMPFTNNHWLSDVEWCIHFCEPGAYMSKDYYLKSKFYHSSINKRDKILFEHSTIKPLQLVERHILNTTQENDIVLDCFAGSGTTLVACKNNNRKYIGIEIEPKWYKIALDRLNGIDVNGQINMFLR